MRKSNFYKTLRNNWETKLKRTSQDGTQNRNS